MHALKHSDSSGATSKRIVSQKHGTRSLSMEDRSHLPATRHVNVCQQWMALNVHDRARTLYAQKRQVRPSANDS